MPILLIADDDDDLRRTLELLFTCRGYRVVTAADGATALRLAAQHRPDVVLTDFDMPGMDGVQLCEALRADAALRTIPIALHSGSVGQVDLRARGSALCQVLSKPARNADIVATVQGLVARGDHEHEARSAHCLPAA